MENFEGKFKRFQFELTDVTLEGLSERVAFATKALMRSQTRVLVRFVRLEAHRCCEDRRAQIARETFSEL